MEIVRKPFPDNINESNLERNPILSWLLSPADRLNREGDNHNIVDTKSTECWDCAWSADSNLFAWSCGNHIVKLIPSRALFLEKDIVGEKPDETVTIDARQVVTSVAFGSSVGKSTANLGSHVYRLFHWEKYATVLAMGLRNGRIRICDVKTGRILLELVDHLDQVTHLCFAPDDSLVLASSSVDGTVKLWELDDDGNMMKSFVAKSDGGCQGGRSHVNYTAWSPDAKMIAVVGSFKTVLIYDMQSKKCVKKFYGHQSAVSSCDFSPDGTVLVTAALEHVAILWNVKKSSIIAKFGHQYPAPSPWCPREDDTHVNCCKFSSQGTTFTTIATDGYIRFWRVDQPTCPLSISSVPNPLCCEYSGDGKTLAVGTVLGSISLISTPAKMLSLAEFCRPFVNRIPEAAPSFLSDFLQYEATLSH